MGAYQSTQEGQQQPPLLRRRISRIFSRSRSTQSIVVRNPENLTNNNNTNEVNNNNALEVASPPPAGGRVALPGLESVQVLPAPSQFRRLLSSTLERVGLVSSGANQLVKEMTDSADIAAAIRATFANTPNPPLKEQYNKVRFSVIKRFSHSSNCCVFCLFFFSYI